MKKFKCILCKNFYNIDDIGTFLDEELLFCRPCAKLFKKMLAESIKNDLKKIKEKTEGIVYPSSPPQGPILRQFWLSHFRALRL